VTPAANPPRGFCRFPRRSFNRARATTSIRPDNAPSYLLVAQYGFRKVGEQWDDEDGLEFVYEVAAGHAH